MSLGAFVVAFSLDMHSGLERKNPMALLEACRRAFAGVEDACLLLRVTGGQSFPHLHEDLRRRVRPWAWARLVGEETSMSDIYAACDVYASLHHSEGFGLTLAEAMLHGKAVLATGWSGNLEFMDRDTAMLAPYALARLSDPQRFYSPHQTWAYPDIEAAAAALGALAAAPQMRRRLGEKARENVMTRLAALPQAALAERADPAVETRWRRPSPRHTSAFRRRLRGKPGWAAVPVTLDPPVSPGGSPGLGGV